MMERERVQPKISAVRKGVLAVVIVLCMSLTGYAIVQYGQIKNLENYMGTKTSRVLVEELFNPDDQWVPGETKEKVVSFVNPGETEQLIRFIVTESWSDVDGNDFTPENGVTGIGWTAEKDSQWTTFDGTYYYYNYVLSPGEDTDAVMDSVLFSKSMNNGSYAADAVDYSDKIYSLKIQMEALPVDSDMTGATWNLNFTQEGNVISWKKLP